MPFIKVFRPRRLDRPPMNDNSFHVNSDLVAMVTADKLIFENRETVQLTPESIAHFLTCVEAQSAMLETLPDKPSLKTLVAQALRYDHPSGLDFDALVKFANKRAFGNIDLRDALNELIAENLVILIVGVNLPDVYQHASHFKRPVEPDAESTPSPDPLGEAGGW